MILSVGHIESLHHTLIDDHAKHKAIEERIGVALGQMEKDMIRVRELMKRR
jgi:hypothetical protein